MTYGDPPMYKHTDRAPLLRLASSLPVGSPQRKTILAALVKEAGVMDDTLARADLLSGALKKSKTADRGPVLEVMQGGIGGFFEEWNKWTQEKIAEYDEVKDLAELSEADLTEDDAAALDGFNKRFRTYGPVASQLLDLLGQIGESDKGTYNILSNRLDYKLREAIMAGAAKGLHGMVQRLDSGRRQVTDIGRGGISTPGSMGVDAEDLAQVMLAGGVMMPGMIFDMNMSDKTDVGGGIKVRGKFKDRKKPWSPAGTSVYTIAGAARGPYIKPSSNYARTVAMNAAVDWKRSVHVALEHILTPADEQEGAETHAINMGGKASLETLMGAEEIAGVPVSRQLILAHYYIRKIEKKLDQMLKAGAAKATWQAVMSLVKDRKNPWKKDGAGDFAINVPLIVKFLESTPEGQEIMRKNGMEKADKRVIQARWKDAVKNLKKALSQLSDDELLSSLHLTLEGLVDDVPAHIRKIKEDKDLYQTYLSDLRKTASEKKEATRTITASERSAMIRLAATLPVGSPERRALLAGCEKLPAGPMRENCEKKKEESGKKEAAGNGKVPDALKKHQFTSEDNPNPKGNDKDGDGKSNEPSPVKAKKAEHHEESKEKYPWPECIKDQEKEYGSKEVAEKVCGKIKAESQGRSASPKSALIRLAASMPKGSEERKTLIRMAAGA